MNLKRAVAVAIILSSTALGAAQVAQASGLRDADPPAEFPPADYTGRQYVDSRGCVYIRTGVDGLVNWVPRVTRGREHICGAKPTFAGPIERDLPVIADPIPTTPVAQPAPAKVAAAPVAPKPAPKPAPTLATSAAVTTASTTTQPSGFRLGDLFRPTKRTIPLERPTVPAPQPRVVKAQPTPAPVIRQQAPLQVQYSCANLPEITRRHMGAGSGVRCGPQQQSPVTGTFFAPRNTTTTGVVQTATGNRVKRAPLQITVEPQLSNIQSTSAGARIVPRHVAEKQRQANAVRVPKGYRIIWEDERLNPKRAHQTQAGKQQMELVWTKTVPRVLIERRTGRNVTSQFPTLVYPYTDLETQRRAFAETPKVRVKSKTQKVRSFVSPQAEAPARQAYVQVGMFGVPSNAQTTAQKLKQSGLPVRIWTSTRNGKNYRTVVAGPFASDGQARSALKQVRSRGFSDAFLR